MNPAFGERWPIGWVVEDANGTIVGTIGNIPMAYRFDGKPVMAAATRGWAVDPDYRWMSFALMAKVMSQNVDLHLATTAGVKAGPIFTGLRYARVPVGQWDHCAFWITNYAGFACACLRRGLKRFFVAPSGGGETVCGSWRAKTESSRRRENLTLDVCNDFDERFDAFWEESCRTEPKLLVAVRDRNSLAWHYHRAIARNALRVVTASDGRRITAYAVFERIDNPLYGLKRVRLMDFQCIPGGRGSFPAIFSFALERCREDGVHVLENEGCWIDSAKLLPEPSGYRRDLKRWTYYYKGVNRDLARALQNPEFWFPTAYDGDYSL